jgi:hypothetical protein
LRKKLEGTIRVLAEAAKNTNIVMEKVPESSLFPIR